MSERKRIVENIISLGVLQVVNYVLPLVIMPYLMRVLGEDKYGLIVFAQAIVQYFVVLTDYGFVMTAARDVAVNRDDPRRVSEIVATVILIKCCLMALGFLILTGIILAVPSIRAEWRVYYLWFMMVLGSVLFPVFYFQGMEQMRYITILNVIARSAALGALFIFVRSPNDYMIATGIQAGAFVLGGAMSLAMVLFRCGVRVVCPTGAQIRSTLKEGSQVFVSTLSGNIYGQGSVIVTGLVAGHAAAGYYTMARNVTNAVSWLIQPVAQGVYPNLSRRYADGDAGYYRFRRKILGLGAVIAVGASIALFVGSGVATVVLAGKQVPLLTLLLKLMSVTLFFTIANVLIGPMILSMKRYVQMQKMYIAAAILFLAVAIPAAFKFGAPGVAVSITLVELFVFGGGIRIARLLA